MTNLQARLLREQAYRLRHVALAHQTRLSRWLIEFASELEARADEMDTGSSLCSARRGDGDAQAE